METELTTSIPSLLAKGPHIASISFFVNWSDNEGGNRKNRLCLESRTPLWAGLCTLSSMPSIYGNDIPIGKPGPWMEEPQGSLLLKEYPNYLCNQIES